jgi:hypothetical protein
LSSGEFVACHQVLVFIRFPSDSDHPGDGEMVVIEPNSALFAVSAGYLRGGDAILVQVNFSKAMVKCIFCDHFLVII